MFILMDHIYRLYISQTPDVIEKTDCRYRFSILKLPCGVILELNAMVYPEERQDRPSLPYPKFGGFVVLI